MEIVIAYNFDNEKQQPSIVRELKGKSLLTCDINNYIVLDLETTGLDARLDEIIEIGAIKVENGKKISSYSTLVKPPFELPEFIEKLTGITNEMLVDAPALKNVLPSFLEFVGDEYIVGHNVNFDINFIYDAVFKLYNGKAFSNNFIDTMRLSRRIFKDYESHRLNTLCYKFGLKIKPTHRAMADCEATFECYEYIKRYVTENNIDLNIFKATNHGVKAKEITSTASEYDENHPLFGKVCVFTGALSFTRREAMQMVADVGGINGDNVSKKTNYLILGNFDYIKNVQNNKSNKVKKAEELILQGQDISIISEDVFLELLKD